MILIFFCIGKGTSSRDGAAFAGALLEWMNSRQLHGVFATHLHELLDMKLNITGVKLKRMGMTISGNFFMLRFIDDAYKMSHIL